MTMHAMNELRAAKKAARAAFEHIEGVEGVGIGDDVIRAYIRSPGVRKTLPVEIEGIPVECVVVGEIVATPDETDSEQRAK